MKRSAFAVSVLATSILSLLVCEAAVACGGSGGGLNSGSSRGLQFARSSQGGMSRCGPSSSPASGVLAMQRQHNLLRQQSAAQIANYHAKMKPLRIARATKMREDKVAAREARSQIRIAKLEAKKREQQSFLAKARTWRDQSGEFELQAILVDANGWGVKLRKQTGAMVNVPIDRLSSSDQSYVARVIADRIQDGAMFVGL
ncbi:MAG: hypothetical protein HKN47_11865 [Pirellulaceae bacterium]|nr:hypothetical protein [Pirellulaceae bacterium]